MSRAAAFLGVHPNEERGVALMTAHSLFVGCATVFFETAVSATFLARFESSYIPWVYIAAAGVNTVTGSVYSRMQRRASFARLMKGTLWFLLATVLAVRLGFALSSAALVAFLGLVAYRVLSSLTDLEYWAVASRIYDVRQAKRLFGVIGSGEVFARIVGSFAVPFLVALTGVSNLILISAAALGLCLVTLGGVLRPIRDVHEAPASVDASGDVQPRRAGLREIASSPYLLLVVGVAVLATFGKYFVDFAFLEQLSTTTRGEERLATIIGLFNGLTQTLSLLTRLFVSRPLLHRFGIRAGVVMLPALHAVCAAATIVCSLLGAGTPVVFWLVIANQGIYKTFKHPIDNASFKVLYQPLQSDQRLAAQIAVEVIFSPVVVAMAGGVMLLFSAGMTYDPVRFSFVLLANFVAWALLARSAGRAYAVKLLDNLRRRIEGNVTLPFDDATTLSVLRARAASDDAEEACVALGLLEKAEPRDLVAMLVTATSHASPGVRHYALERLLELSPAALADVRKRISMDPEPSVRRAAMKVVAVSAGDAAVQELTEHLDDSDLMVRRAAVTLLFEMADDAGRAVATKAVAALAASAAPDERKLGARLAGEHALEDVLRPLLDDSDPDVKRAAIAGAGRLSASWVVPALLEHLIAPRFAQSAAASIALRGDRAIVDLAPRFHSGESTLVLRRLVYVHRLVGGPSAVAALRAHLRFPDATVRGRVLAALDRLRYTAHEAERDDVRALALDEAREAAWTLGALRDLQDERDLEALRSALDDEVQDARARIFHCLAFVHERVAVQRVAAHVAHPSSEKRAYAQEVLDLLLDRDERDALVPLLDDATNAGRLARIIEHFPQPVASPEQRLRQLVARSGEWQTDWTRALAIRDAAARNVASGAEAWIASRDPIVRETAVWAEGGARASAANRANWKERTSMLLIEKVILLKMVQVFAHTPEELLAEIAAMLEEVRYRKGETIFEKGDAGESMYIVVSGRVRVLDGESTLSVLGEKEIFGELALLDPEPRSASVEAVEDARLFRLDRDTFEQLMAGNLEIVRGVLHVLCERLRRTSAFASRRAL